jgi:hypothetical protein
MSMGPVIKDGDAIRPDAATKIVVRTDMSSFAPGQVSVSFFILFSILIVGFAAQFYSDARDHFFVRIVDAFSRMQRQLR